jgi:hypothetical protein
MFPRNTSKETEKIWHRWYNAWLAQQLFKNQSTKSLHWFYIYLSSGWVFNILAIQDSSPGPILFLIYINDLHNCTKLLTLMFADEAACAASDINLVNFDKKYE